MSLKKSINQATKRALSTMSSLREMVTYRSIGNVSYDPNTGVPTHEVRWERVIPGWSSSYKDKEIDGNNVQPRDKRFTIKARDISFNPKLNDLIVDSKGVTWQIINVKRETSQNLVILQIREP